MNNKSSYDGAVFSAETYKRIFFNTKFKDALKFYRADS